jgi:protein involved in polysaccharide export with SLBB domain
VGKGAVERVLASAFLAFGCVGLAGCSPQSNSGFQAVANPSPTAAAVQQQPLQTAAVLPASTPNTPSVQPQPPQGVSAAAKDAGPNAAAVRQVASPATFASVSTSDYQVRPGDVLQINVFQLQDFTREAPVDAAGTIALPLIGTVPVAGKTVRQIEAEIAQRLGAKYLQNPQVLVTVKDAVGLRVAVQGAVKSPGVLPLHGDTTLTNVIAQSGGFTEISDQSQVLIIRNTDQGRVATKVDAGAILSGLSPDPQVYGGDTVVVGESFIRNVEKDALTLTGGASTLGWLLIH